MLKISEQIIIPDHEIELKAVRSQGAGGQNVNKVATAIHLRFDVKASSLPYLCKDNLLRKLNPSQITQDGVIIIKAQQFRTQERNKIDALERLQSFINKATHVTKTRRPTNPSRNAKRKPVNQKTQRGKTKALRGKVAF